MKVKFLLGGTFIMRCGWIQEIRDLVERGQFPPAYQKTVVNLTAAYFLMSLINRHLTRLRTGFSPVELLISITDWCPHHCRYCYNSSGTGEKKITSIDLNKLDMILTEMKNAFGIRFAIITGGEPFPYVLKLATRRQDFTFFTYTSGNIDAQMCREMAKLGNIIPALTIVDTDPLIHDYVRGNGSFNRIMSAKNLLQDHRLPWGWSLTSSQLNCRHIIEGDLLEKLAAQKPYFIRAMPWMPVGRSDENLVLSPEQMIRIGTKIREAKKQGVPVFDYITAPVGYPCLAGGLRSFFLAPGPDNGIRVSPCVFMESEVSVPLKFDRDGHSSLLQTLQTNSWFKESRKLAGQHQCIIHENREKWVQLIKKN